MAAEIRPDRLTPILQMPLGKQLVSYLGDPQLARVSRAFCSATHKAQVESLQAMRGTNPRHSQEMFDACARLLPEGVFLENGMHDLLQQIDLQDVSEDVSILWEKIKQLHNRALQANDPAARQRCLSRLYITLHPLRLQLAEMRYSQDDKETIAEQVCPILRRCIAEENLMQRVNTLCARHNFDPTSVEEAPLCIAAFHRAQKRTELALGDLPESVAQPARGWGGLFSLLLGEAEQQNELHVSRSFNFSHTHALECEESFLSSQRLRQLSANLQRLWATVKPVIGHAGPAIAAPSYEIEQWMDDPANEAALRQCTGLMWSDDLLPPQIGRLNGLQRLNCSRVNNGLRAVPDELRNLRELTEIYLEGTRFSEIPEPIIDLAPQLEVFWLSNNQEHIRIFPDELWRDLRETKWRFVLDDYHLYTLCISRRHLGGSLLADLRAGLTDAPFGVLFAERAKLPYISQEAALGPLGLAAIQLEFARSGWEILGSSVFLFFAAGLGLVLFPTFELLNLLIASYNLLLVYAIEPALTALRDLLGYPRMVHVRDLQPGEA